MIAVQIPVGVVSCALSLGRVRQDHRVSVRPTLASRLQYSSVQGRFASHCHRVVVTHHNSGGGRVGGAAQRSAQHQRAKQPGQALACAEQPGVLGG
jgi:hypothetical protein